MFIINAGAVDTTPATLVEASSLLASISFSPPNNTTIPASIGAPAWYLSAKSAYCAAVAVPVKVATLKFAYDEIVALPTVVPSSGVATNANWSADSSQRIAWLASAPLSKTIPKSFALEPDAFFCKMIKGSFTVSVDEFTDVVVPLTVKSPVTVIEPAAVTSSAKLILPVPVVTRFRFSSVATLVIDEPSIFTLPVVQCDVTLLDAFNWMLPLNSKLPPAAHSILRSPVPDVFIFKSWLTVVDTVIVPESS